MEINLAGSIVIGVYVNYTYERIFFPEIKSSSSYENAFACGIGCGEAEHFYWSFTSYCMAGMGKYSFACHEGFNLLVTTKPYNETSQLS